MNGGYNKIASYISLGVFSIILPLIFYFFTFHFEFNLGRVYLFCRVVVIDLLIVFATFLIMLGQTSVSIECLESNPSNGSLDTLKLLQSHISICSMIMFVGIAIEWFILTKYIREVNSPWRWYHLAVPLLISLFSILWNQILTVRIVSFSFLKFSRARNSNLPLMLNTTLLNLLGYSIAVLIFNSIAFFVYFFGFALLKRNGEHEIEFSEMFNQPVYIPSRWEELCINFVAFCLTMLFVLGLKLILVYKLSPREE